MYNRDWKKVDGTLRIMPRGVLGFRFTIKIKSLHVISGKKKIKIKMQLRIHVFVAFTFVCSTPETKEE